MAKHRGWMRFALSNSSLWMLWGSRGQCLWTGRLDWESLFQGAGEENSADSQTSDSGETMRFSSETIQPTSTHGKLLTSAVTHRGVHLFCHHPDHFTGHSLVACLFADNSFPHVYLKLLAHSQPGTVPVLLEQTLKHINQNLQQTDPFCSLFFRSFLLQL